MKKFLRIWKKTALCTVMALLMTVTMVLAPVSTVSALVLPTLSLGDAENFQWDGREGYLFKITVDSTGLYDLIITDNYQMGAVNVRIENEYGSWEADFNGETTETCITANMFVSREYWVYCSYAVNVEGAEGRADLTFELVRNTTTEVLPLCDISNSNALTRSYGDDDSEWFEFTTTEAGDYTLNFDELHAYVDVIYADGAGYAYMEVDTERRVIGGSWISRNKLTFSLYANTKYYLRIDTYRASDTRLSVTKNAKTVSNVLPVAPNSKIDCIGWDLETYLSYRIEYTDESYEVLSYTEAVADGIIPPYAELIEQNSDIKPAGKQLAMAWGHYGEYTFYVDVEPLYEHLISVGHTNAIGEYNTYTIENPDCYDMFEEYVRLKVGYTGVYDFFASEVYGSSYSQMDYTNFTILDARNKDVNYIEGKGYPLVAGEEYVIVLRYVFAQDETDDFKFHPQRTTEGNLFPDTYKGTWYYDPVAYTYGAGIMSGYGDGKFGPSDGIQRQDFLVMLGRMEGIYEGVYEGYNHGGFSDFDQNSYYAGAVNWGYENRIVTGYLDGKFGVGDKITREQIVTFLYRYAKYKGHNVEVSATSANAIKAKYKDFSSVSEFSEEAILWAIDRGVINGKTSNTIAPQGTAQRCEVAQIMYNIFKNEIL